MKLKNVNIRNFRVLKDISFDFTGDDGSPLNLIVFAGPNGTGKTSVIEACLLALGHKELLGPRGDFKVSNEESSERPSVRLTLTMGGEDHEVCYETCVAGKGIRTSGAEYGSDYFSSWRSPKLVGSVSVTSGKRGRRKATFLEENRLRLVKEYLVNYTARKSFDGENRPSFDVGPFDRINRAWSLFYPEKKDRFEARPAGTIEEGFDVYLTDQASRVSFPLDVLSAGEIEVFTMLGWFATGQGNPFFLFIDEPELHLHPAWQRIILKALREVLPQAQFIVSTQSPQVLSSINAESVWLLRREAGNVQASKPEDSYGLDSNRILEDLMGASERPPEIKEELRQLFLAIDKGKTDDARTLLASLKKLITGDPELTKAEALIRRKEIVGR